MNLRLIEKRFQNLNAQANLLDYRFNPNSAKIEGLNKHAYLNELKEDQENDKKIFGRDPYYTRKIDKNSLLQFAKGAQSQFADHTDLDDHKQTEAHGESKSQVGRSGASANPKMKQQINQDSQSQVRPHTSQPLTKANAFSKKMQIGQSAKGRLSIANKTTKSQHQLLQKKIQHYKKTCHYDWDLNVGNLGTNQSSHNTLQHAGNAYDMRQTASKTGYTAGDQSNTYNPYDIQSQDHLQSLSKRFDQQQQISRPVSHAGAPSSLKVSQSAVPNLLDRAKLQEDQIVMKRQFQMSRSRPRIPAIKGMNQTQSAENSRYDLHNLQFAKLEYQKQLEIQKRQKEADMNLEGLLEGIFQIRVPDYIIQELMTDQDEVFVDHEGKTPVKVLTDKTATGQKDQKDSANNNMEDYQNTLGEMQMIQNMRISENGSGMLMRGSSKYRHSVNVSQNETINARKMFERCLSNSSNQERQPNQRNSGARSNNDFKGQGYSPYGRVKQQSFDRANQHTQSNEKTVMSTSPQQPRGTQQKLSLNTPNKMSPRFNQIQNLQRQSNNRGHVPNNTQTNEQIKISKNAMIIHQQRMLHQHQNNILMQDQNNAQKQQNKYFMNQLENDYRETSSRDLKSQSALYQSGRSNPIDTQQLIASNQYSSDQDQQKKMSNISPMAVAAMKNSGEVIIDRQGASSSNILKNGQDPQMQQFDKKQLVIASQDTGTAKMTTQFGSEMRTDEMATDHGQLSPDNISRLKDSKLLQKEGDKYQPNGGAFVGNHLKGKAIIGGTSIEIKNNRINFDSENQFKMDLVKVTEAQMMVGMETPLPATSKPNEQTQTQQTTAPQAIKLTLKLTDLSDPRNPFVVLENRPLTSNGSVTLHDSFPGSEKDICQILPWLREPSDILKRTIKLEVIFKMEVVMCRYLHLNVLFPVEYPKIALQICQNLYLNQYMKYKQNKLETLLKEQKGTTHKIAGPKSGQHDQDDSSKSNQKAAKSSQSAAGQLMPKDSPSTSNKQTFTKDKSAQELTIDYQKKIQIQLIQESTPIFVFDGAKNVLIQPEEGVLNSQIIQKRARRILQNDGLQEQLTDITNSSFEKELQFYFSIPIKDRFYELLQETRSHQFHLRDLPEQIQKSKILQGSGIQPRDLTKFPKFQKNQQKILIEFQDCIIQANDLVDFQILVDDNEKRAVAMMEFEEENGQSFGIVRGHHVSKDQTKLRSFNNIFEYNKKSFIVPKKEAQSKADEQNEKKQRELSQVVLSRGAEMLVRKYQTKRAEELRRITERRPLQPNLDLVAKSGNTLKSPKCAAELTDQQAIRDHLLNTSLLTAPLFYNNYKVYEQQRQMDLLHMWNFQQLQYAQSSKPILSKNVFSLNASKGFQSNNMGMDDQYLDEMAYLNGMMFSKDLNSIPGYNNADIDFRQNADPQMEVTGFNIMTQTDDPDIGRSQERVPESTLNLHTTQKTDDTKGQQLPVSNRFQFAMKVGRTNKQVYTLSNQKSSVSGDKDIKVGNQAGDRDTAAVRSVFSLNSKQATHYNIKKKDRDNTVYNSQKKMGIAGQLTKPEIIEKSVVVFGNKIDMNDKQTVVPTIQLSKKSISSQQSKEQPHPSIGSRPDLSQNYRENVTTTTQNQNETEHSRQGSLYKKTNQGTAHPPLRIDARKQSQFNTGDPAEPQTVYRQDNSSKLAQEK